MPGKRPTLLIDFDGVLHDYKGWNNGAIGAPLGGARAAMHLLEKKYRLVLFSSRTNIEELERWLRHYGFPPMKVTNRKEPAFLIIDDRAVTFQGTWSDHFISRITSFSPHWQATGPPLGDDSGEPVVQPPTAGSPECEAKDTA